MSKNTKTVILLLIAAVLIAVIPLFVRKDAEFGGSDDAGSVMIEEIQGEYTPWFTPVLENALGGEIPGEVESLIFCVQTGIGVGIIAFFMGRFVERKKWMKAAGAEGAILGCTEIGLLIHQGDTDFPLFDTTLIHARAAAERALQSKN